LNLLVGNPGAGAAYFARSCAACHSATGDLSGIASRITDVALLQSTWVGGVAGVLGRVAPEPRRPTLVTVTPRSGAPITGRLLRMDDFVVVLALDDGTQRSFRRESGESPLVDVKNPLEEHRRLMTVLTDKDMHDVTAYLATLR
jgi:cytochrome c oxidase cbb3-type subunit 3